MDKNTDKLIHLGYSDKDAILLGRQFSDLICYIASHEGEDAPEYSEIQKAFLFAANVHKNQRRKSGEPYMVHPLAVARIIADIDSESETIEAGLLHDVLEDSRGTDHEVTYEELLSLFGQNVADLVEAVTNFDSKETALDHQDLDYRSDEKLVQSMQAHPTAFYIKVADRIHNLRTIQNFNYQKKVAKVNSTRKILIPIARKWQAYRLVDVMEDLCFQIENANLYKIVQDNYKKLCGLNRHALEDGQKYFSEYISPSGTAHREGIADCRFYDRFIYSIYRFISREVRNGKEDPAPALTKKVPLQDIYLIISDSFEGSTYDPLFKIYEEMLRDPHGMTILSVEENTNGESYFLFEDRYAVRYRVFVERQSQYRKRFNGFMVSEQSVGKKSINQLKIPTVRPEDTIRVFKRNGSPIDMPVGSTVLDLAFAIHKEVGLCARYALMNHQKSHMPLYTRLSEGDYIEIISDSDKENPSNSIRHANIRWFEYLHTESAIHALSRYLEKNIESARTVTVAFCLDENGEAHRYEIQTGATALDLAFLVDPQTALHLTSVFLNNSHTRVKPDRVVRYGDQYRFAVDMKKEGIPQIRWFNYIKTERARKWLIEYFS